MINGYRALLTIRELVTDPYNRKARLQPVLFGLLPGFIAVMTSIPNLESSLPVFVGLVVCCGGATWLTQIGRDRGKALEPALFAAWGGKPSVAILRHRDTRLAEPTKKRYRAFLQRRVPGLTLASLEEEDRSPIEADSGYESATNWLLAQTRDRERFRLIFEENMNYGFRRNTWALKPYVFAVDGITVGGMVALLVRFVSEGTATEPGTVDSTVLAALVVALVHLLVFAFWIEPTWVRVPAEAYAQQLLAACDQLEDVENPRSQAATSMH